MPSARPVACGRHHGTSSHVLEVQVDFSSVADVMWIAPRKENAGLYVHANPRRIGLVVMPLSPVTHAQESSGE